MNFIAKTNNELSAKEFAMHTLPSNAVILDVRTLEEWNAGHIKGARHIDYFSESFEDEIKKLDIQATYYVYCRAGRRSAGAIHYMQKEGFEHCINIIDGMIGIEQTTIELEK